MTLRDGSYLLARKNVSSFTDEEEENYAKQDAPPARIRPDQAGAIFHKTGPRQPFSIADGNLVTGQNPASAKGVAEKTIKLLAAA